MAYIQEKVKGKKIVSFKIKACLGRDANGKQLFKCTTWYPPADLTPAKARKEAQKVAGVWEEEVRQNYIKEQEARAVAGELPAPAPVYTFDAFVNEVWVPLCVRDGSHRPATVAMYTNILKIILPQFQGVPMNEISGVRISQYLRWLRNEYRKPNGKPLAEKSIKYILTWVVHNVADLKHSDVEFVFKTEAKSAETQNTNHGGITLEEWTALHGQLKAEEEKRERLNWQRKNLATDSLPFAIVPDLVAKVIPQLQAETEHYTYQALKGSLEGEAFFKVLSDATRAIGSTKLEQDTDILFTRISDYLLDRKWEKFEPLFGLSSDEEMQVQSVLNRVNSFDPKTFKNYQKRINSSLERTKEIRAKLQASSIEHFENYVQTLSVLEEELKITAVKKEHAEELLTLKQAELEQKESKLRILKKTFE